MHDEECKERALPALPKLKLAAVIPHFQHSECAELHATHATTVQLPQGTGQELPTIYRH
jgi:hypothetical protein